MDIATADAVTHTICSLVIHDGIGLAEKRPPSDDNTGTGCVGKGRVRKEWGHLGKFSGGHRMLTLWLTLFEAANASHDSAKLRTLAPESTERCPRVLALAYKY